MVVRSSHCPPLGELAFFVVQPCVFAVQPFARSRLAPWLGFFWWSTTVALLCLLWLSHQHAQVACVPAAAYGSQLAPCTFGAFIY